MVAALGVEDLAIADAAVVDHLGVVETEEHVEHRNFEVENAEMAVEGHTAAAAAVAAAQADYKLEEHNWDDSFEQTTEWELDVGAAVAADGDAAAGDAAARAIVVQDSRFVA